MPHICKICNGIKIDGRCQSCGDFTPCAWCGGVVQEDGSVKFVKFIDTGNLSHGICQSCAKKEMAEARNYIHTTV